MWQIKLLWQMSRGHKLHQYSKTRQKVQVIAAKLTDQTGFILCSEKNSVNPLKTKNMFCLNCQHPCYNFHYIGKYVACC